MKVLVLTISDRASKGVYEDTSGPEIEKTLLSHYPNCMISRAIVPDSESEIKQNFLKNLSQDLIITTGGTGIGPRDRTPEITENFCDRLIPGIAEYLRTESRTQTMNAVLSRGSAGIRGKTIIVNVPGSIKGAIFCTELLAPLIPHALKMISGGGH